ncbi:hypothetical protein Ciccas_012408 [Cichlidogyrus casuarinus]|uniref:SCP domain-containing protein n=1 Tax=Cichlidogyrus casuarinus TaxID=1844966 RepID=A0ABD2PNG3_9PLAT
MVKILLSLFAIAIVGAMAMTCYERRTFLNRHNQLRGDLVSGKVPGQPKAKSMTPMIWDNGLQATAQKKADSCVFSHDTSADRTPAGQATDPLYGWIGQNLAMLASSTGRFNSTSAMDMWWNEYKDYTYATKTCAPRKACGHYTQMAWANTKNLGCAKKICPINEKISMPWMIIVCNYAYGGNFNNEFPYVKA